MNNISLIVGYDFFYEDTALMAEDYINNISRQKLLDYGILFCSIKNNKKGFCGFLKKNDFGTKYYTNIISKIKNAFEKGENIDILNLRTSLRLLELILTINKEVEEKDFSDIEIRERMFKAYLVLNSECLEKKNNFINPETSLEYLIINTSLKLGREENMNIPNLLLAQTFKSLLFFEYAEDKMPKHLAVFLNEYGINKWNIYIEYIINLVSYASENCCQTIYLNPKDLDFESKRTFLERFCVPINFDRNMDFIALRSTPIIYNKKEKRYNILYLPFLIEKIYSSLYFSFKDINDKLANSEYHIKPNKFRNDFGFEFSEKYLLNIVMRNSFKGKFRHLGAQELTDEGLSDYYMRNGKKILLIENKDNLISKEIMDKRDLKDFIIQIKKCFYESDNKGRIKPKAIKQLCNNINKILCGQWKKYDKQLKYKNCSIYPVIVVHHKEFTLPGINQLVNNEFKKEINNRKINTKQIKDLTIIDIDTLIVYQDVISENKNNIYKLIDEYWTEYKCNKNYPCKEALIDSLPEKYKNFDQFISKKFLERDILKGELKKKINI